MKKQKAKSKRRHKDLKLDYSMRAILNASAVEFRFAEKLDIVAIHVPTIGVLVVGKNNPFRVWSYPPETPFKDAVSKTFGEILASACENDRKKAKKA
jgi:hypothetical protein